MSGADGANILLLALMVSIVLFYLIIPSFYQNWKKARRRGN